VAGPEAALTAPPLVVMIAAARSELRAETPLRLHAEHAPKLLDADGVATHYPDEGGIGLPFTAGFHRLLALRERFQQEYLMRESLLEVSNWCHGQHVTHRREAQPTPVCAWLLELAIRLGQDPPHIAWMTGSPEAPIRDLLAQALTYAANWRESERQRLQVEINAYAGETITERLRREHDLRHEQRTWELLRVKYPAMAAWELELDRRRAEHERLSCENCVLLPRAA